MSFHRNAKLGLAGRYALVSAVGGGMSLKQARADSVSGLRRRIVGGTDGRTHRRGARRRCRVWGIGQPSTSLARGSWHRSWPDDLRLPARHRLGAASGGATGYAHSTVWKVLNHAGALAAAAGRAGASPPLRVALPRRSAAHGHKRVRPLPAARPPSHRRDRSTRTKAMTSTTCTRSSTTTTSYAYAEIHPDQRAQTVADFLGAGPGLLRRTRHHRETRDDRRRLDLRQEPRREPTPRPPPDPTLHHQSPTGHAPTARSNASTDDGTRIGLRLTYSSHHERTAALPHWLHHYDTTRPHSSLAGQPRSAAFTTSVGRTARR